MELKVGRENTVAPSEHWPEICSNAFRHLEQLNEQRTVCNKENIRPVRAQTGRTDRRRAFRRHLGAARPLQAGPQPGHRDSPDCNEPYRATSVSHSERAKERCDTG